jgi:hypothetical protein
VVSKPVYTLLEQRLAPCKLPGTSITESGITVSIDRRQGEIISFFRPDSEAGRNCLDMMGSRACDCLVFYSQETQHEEKLCLLELKKPAKTGDAKKQILAVYHAVNKILNAAHVQGATWMVFICMRRHNVLPGDRRHINELKDYFGEKVKCRRSSEEFGSFLRR